MTRLFAHPVPIQVTADPAGVPQGINYGGRWRTVVQIANRWRTTSSWWNPEAAARRKYVKLVTDDGLLCTVYRDMTNDAWYIERIYD